MHAIYKGAAGTLVGITMIMSGAQRAVALSQFAEVVGSPGDETLGVSLQITDSDARGEGSFTGFSGETDDLTQVLLSFDGSFSLIGADVALHFANGSPSGPGILDYDNLAAADPFSFTVDLLSSNVIASEGQSPDGVNNIPASVFSFNFPISVGLFINNIYDEAYSANLVGDLTLEYVYADTPANVPLPAALPLALAGLGALAGVSALRRRVGRADLP